MGKDALTLGLIVLVVLLLMRRQQVSNAETWEWVDYKGNQRSMTIHRDVRSS